MPTAYLLQGKDRLPRGEANDLGGAELYATRKLASLFQRLKQPTLATRTSTATSLLFLFAILAVGMASMYSFRTQLTNVMIAEQNTLVERIADNLDQKLRALQRALLLSAIEIKEADVTSSDAAQEYLDSNGGLYAAFDRSIFLFSDQGILLAEPSASRIPGCSATSPRRSSARPGTSTS